MAALTAAVNKVRSALSDSADAWTFVQHGPNLAAPLRHDAASWQVDHVPQAPTPAQLAMARALAPTASRLARTDSTVIPYVMLNDLLRPLLVVSTPDSAGPCELKIGGMNCLSIARPPLAVFVSQIPQVLALAKHRDDRSDEILAQMDNFLAFYAALLPLGWDKTPATMRLLGVAVELAMHVHFQFKHHLACARPCDYSAQVQPMIRTPGHSTLPMGHMVEALVVSRVLCALTKPSPPALPAGYNVPAWDALSRMLMRLAERIGYNRIVAGVHFPLDQVGGQALGHVVADYLLGLCDLAGNTDTVGIARRTFAGIETDADTVVAGEFAWPQLHRCLPLTALWAAARDEWGDWNQAIFGASVRS